MGLKICVYAICRNEEQFVKRFMDSAKDADLISIADTGSTDKTMHHITEWALNNHTKVDLYQISIKPWRFDHARNAGLALIPDDIDVCFSVDLDEVIQPGWRQEIERLWVPGTTRMTYFYDWGMGAVFNYNKIISRHGYYHKHPCHEYEQADPRTVESMVWSPMLMVKHFPDGAKSRGFYGDLLAASVQEDPHCSRNAFYYARELSFQGKWEESIKELDRYLALPGATWPHERAYACVTKGRCYVGLGDKAKAQAAFFDGAKERPDAREPWIALARISFMDDWACMFAYAMKALSITTRAWSYCDDPASWESLPHSLACVAAWNLGLKDIALEQGRIAVTKKPSDFCDAEANLKSMGG